MTNDSPDNLEHLFTRRLDGESTPAEQELLDALLASDAQARRRFAAYQELDREVGDALRAALGRRPRHATLRPFWGRVGKGLTVAVAACLAALAWLRPAAAPSTPLGQPQRQNGTFASWFAPQQRPADVVDSVPVTYERPQLKLRGTDREWLVIPADEPGRYFVIEVDRVQTHAIAIQKDF